MFSLARRILLPTFALAGLLAAPLAVQGGSDFPARISVPLETVIGPVSGAGDSIAQGSVVYTDREGVDLAESSRPRADAVATLKKGSKLTIVETRGPRLKVRTEQNLEGWVMRFLVTDSKPKRSLGDVKVVSSGDLDPQERSDISSIRGLKPITEEYAEDADVPQKAVEDARMMESIAASINERDVDRFLEEGGI